LDLTLPNNKNDFINSKGFALPLSQRSPFLLIWML